MSEMIGRLRVALGLETASFEKGAKRATAEINTLGSKTEQAALKVGNGVKTIAAAGGALAGSAIVAQLKSMVEESLAATKAMDQMAKVSNTNIVEFQKLAFAAKSVGIEQEQLSDMLKDVNEKVGEFVATGGGELKDFFENIAPKVGVTAEQFAKLSGPEALQLYVSSLEKAGLSQQQMTFYMEAIANDGTKLIPILRNNGEAAKEMGEKAKQSGLIMSQELADRSVKAGQKIDDLKAKLSSRWDIAVGQHADKISAIVDKIDQLVRGFMNLIAQMEKFGNTKIGRLLAGGSGQITSALGYLNPVTMTGKAVDAALSAAAGGSAGTAPATAKKATIAAPQLLRKSATNFAGGSTLLPSASRTLAGMQPGDASALFPWITNDAKAMEHAAKLLSQTVEDEAEKVDVANVQIARSFGEMAQSSIDALDRLAGAVRGGGALDVLSAILGVGLQLGSMGVFGKGVQANINAPRIPAYANGTSFHPGGLALVGERGPEIAALPRGTAVFPNGMGPGGMTNNYFSGNLMTPEFWAMIQNGDRTAAQIGATVGAEGGFAKVAKANNRRIGY